MPGKDPISQLGDLAALQANADKIMEIVAQVVTSIKSVPEIAFNYKNSGGGAELKKNTEDLVRVNTELTQAQRQLNAEQEKAKTLDSEMAKQIALLREQNRAKTNELKQEAQDTLGVTDAYKKLSLQYQEAARAAKNLAATPGTDPQAIAKANATAKAFSDQLKAIDAAVGQNQRNVGNYIGAVQVLDKSLGEIKNRMDQLTSAGKQNDDEFQRLAKEYALLTQLNNQQAKGFMSVTMEIRSVEKALVTMQAAGMEGTEAFEQLQLKLAEAQRKMHDFKEEQSLLKSDVPSLAALTTIAKGLGGAYAIAAGGAALLANGNEKVEKELNKLVAIMTILQGLNEVHELFEKKNAIATLANATVQGFKNFILTGSIKTQEAKTAAEAENTVVEEANTLATEANVEAQVAQTVATEAATVATEGAAAGMVAFRVALIATGIGAILVLLASAASAMSVFGKSAKETAEEMAALAESILKVNEAILAQSELANRPLTELRKQLEAQLEYAEKAGKDFYTLMALKKQINDLDREAAENNLKNVSGQKDLAKAIDVIRAARERDAAEVNKVEAIIKDQESGHAAALKRGNAESEKSFKERQATREKELESARKKLEEDTKLLEDQENAEKQHNSLIIETSKFSADEQRELAKATAVTRAQAVIDSNSLILANEKSTQQQRITAESSNLVQQLLVIKAEREARLSAPGLTKVQRAQIEIEAGAAEAKAREQSLANIQKINEDYQKRYLAAEYEIFTASVEAEAKAAESVANDQKKTLNQRLAAYSTWEALQRQLINADAEFQKKKAGQTAEELFAIEVKRQAKLTALAADSQVKQAQVIQGAIEQQRKQLEGKADISGLQIQIAAYQKLIEQFKAGEISAEGFARAKDKIANSAAQDALQQQLVTLQFIQGEYKRYGQDTTDIDKLIAQIRFQLLDKETAAVVKQAELKKKLGDQEIALGRKVADTVASFIDGGFERQLNAVQSQIDANNKLKETETARIANSSLSSQQRAAEQIELDAKVNAQNEALQRKQRDIKIKQAQFDRDKAIFDVIANTAVAITTTNRELGLPAALPFDVIAAAMGAAQIAAILARPIPKFATGTASSPEGWAWTDEQGPELYRTRGGQVFTGSDQGPTLRYLEQGTEIIPHGQYGGPEVEIISYDRLKNWQSFDVSSSHTYENRRLEKKIDELGDRLERIGQSQVDAMKRYRTVIPPSKDPGPEFWAHIYNSCK